MNTTLPNGNAYEGEFTIKDGHANGHGKATYPDGKCYEGKLKDGKANGQPFRSQEQYYITHNCATRQKVMNLERCSSRNTKGTC